MQRRALTGYGAHSQKTHQGTPIPGTSQVQNNAGGYVWPIDDLQQLKRFLILGTVGGTYYVSERKLTKENVDVVERLLKSGRGLEVIELIKAISVERRAANNDQAIFALARCCAADDRAVRRAAYESLQDVCRTGTHLFHFMTFIKEFRGKGRMHREFLKKWYNDKPAERLVYLMLKYQGRDGWTQRDVLRVTRPTPIDRWHEATFGWSTKGWQEPENVVLADQIVTIERTGLNEDLFAQFPQENVPQARSNGMEILVRQGNEIIKTVRDPMRMIWAFEKIKHSSDVNEIAEVVFEYHLTREMVPTESLNNINVWNALLANMPLEATVRNLATMTAKGVLTPLGSMTHLVASRLRDADYIKRGGLHPIAVLKALMQYETGHGDKGKLTWSPVPEIIDALNDAFYLAFGAVTPSHARLVLGLDVSGSMESGMVAGVQGFTPRKAAAAMAMVTAATEDRYTTMAFTSEFLPFPMSARERLDDVMHRMGRMTFGRTDCALPMTWAMTHNVEADAFVIYTDSETWFGDIHPAQALQQYRRWLYERETKRGETPSAPAKLIVVAFEANKFSIADPNDAGMLDCVGFDTGTPQMISEFVAGL